MPTSINLIFLVDFALFYGINTQTWIPYKNKQYYVEPQQTVKSNLEAALNCQKNGDAKVVSFSDDSAYKFIKKRLPLPPVLKTPYAYLIGVTHEDGEYRWLDGQVIPKDYHRWGDGEPRSGKYFVMGEFRIYSKKFRFKVADNLNHYGAHYICEKPYTPPATEVTSSSTTTTTKLKTTTKATKTTITIKITTTTATTTATTTTTTTPITTTTESLLVGFFEVTTGAEENIISSAPIGEESRESGSMDVTVDVFAEAEDEAEELPIMFIAAGGGGGLLLIIVIFCLAWKCRSSPAKLDVEVQLGVGKQQVVPDSIKEPVVSDGLESTPVSIDRSSEETDEDSPVTFEELAEASPILKKVGRFRRSTLFFRTAKTIKDFGRTSLMSVQSKYFETISKVTLQREGRPGSVKDLAITEEQAEVETSAPPPDDEEDDLGANADINEEEEEVQVEDEGGEDKGQEEDEGGQDDDEGGQDDDEGGQDDDEGGRADDEGGRDEDEGGQDDDD